MGSHYCTDLADVCRRAGLNVVEVDGWQTRARGSGGFNDGKPDHVMAHHTASPSSADGWPDVNYCTFGDDDAPLCNLYLSRDGAVYVCAAGGTNTNGKGDCAHLSPDTMNSSAVGIEAGNNGSGEPWPQIQTTAYLLLVDALCAAYRIPADHVHSHAEWAPARKVDPYGPSPWGNQTWNMDAFRADLGASIPQPPPPDLEEDDMARYLVQHPTTGEWMLTDTATYKTVVPHPGTDRMLEQLLHDGTALFGWQGDGDGPWLLGPQWASMLDALPEANG